MEFDQLYSIWRELKSIFQLSGELSSDAAHIHFGLIGFLGFYALFRKRPRPEIKAWLCVCVLEVLNEGIDIFFDVQNIGTVKEWNSIRDVVSTLFWPSMLVIFLTYYQRRQEKL